MPYHFSLRARRFLCLGLLPLALLVMGGACWLEPVLIEAGLVTPAPTADAYSHYRAILQPAAQNDIEAAGPLPQYHVTAQLNEDRTVLQGVMQVTVPLPGPELVFRLYPNLENYGGVSQVPQAQVDGVPVETVSIADNAAIRLALPGETGNNPAPVIVKMAFTVQLNRQPLPEATGADYTLFGWDGPVLSLPGFYPTLAAAQDGEWVLDRPPLFGDVLFNQVALYQLDITLPPDLVVAASGVVLNVIDHPDGSRTWQIAGGPLRDMTVIAAPFQAISDQAAGAVVTAYYQRGHEAAARAALAHAAASLRLYSDLYGPYPYTELDVVEAPLNVRGMEYSGLILVGEDLYESQREFLTFLVAHEVSHQWWYAIVGNNPYRDPWLDEGLAEYSAFDYYRTIFGQGEAEELLVGRWQIPFSTVAGGGIDGAVDRPAAEFDPVTYELLVYAKAALFLNALRQQVGDDTYRQIIQTYFTENRYRIVTPATFLATARRVSGQNVDQLAEEWLK